MIEYEKINLHQKNAIKGPFIRERYRQFFQHLPKDTESVLDVGCSNGIGGETLKDLNPKLSLVGLDCIRERLDVLPPDIYDKSMCCYSTDISCEDSSFDCILAGEFIEHLHPDDVDPSLREFFRCMKYGGRLMLTTPNPNYIRLKITGGKVLGGAHLSEHYPGELHKRLAGIGFSNIAILGSGRMSRFLGERFPVFAFYGSYLVLADKC